MDTCVIPLGDAANADRFILYRPLAGLAFVGNRAMANLARAGETAVRAANSDVHEFLRAIGFYEPDPPAPEPPGADFRPTTAVLLLTNQCQLRCTYCYTSAGELPRQQLSFELGRAAIDYVCQIASELGQSQFEVSFHGGGEPTYAWRVLTACTDYARRRSLPAKIRLTSNGLWSARQCAWIIDQLDGLSLSLDGSPETQNRQRPLASGRPSSPQVMRTVAELDRRAFPYGIRMTATAPWSNFPRDVRFLCGETQCESMQVEPAFSSARGGPGQPDAAEAQAFVEAFLEAFDVASSHGRRLLYSGARLGTVTTAFCAAPFSALIVNANGELVTCYEIAGPAHPLAGRSVIGRIENGNVVLDRAARARLHALLQERRDTCRDCFCYWSCAGDCYPRVFGREAGAHLRHSPRCEINRSITRQLLLRRIADSGGVWRETLRRAQ